jgi:hypothetical protein
MYPFRLWMHPEKYSLSNSRIERVGLWQYSSIRTWLWSMLQVDAVEYVPFDTTLLPPSKRDSIHCHKGNRLVSYMVTVV